MDALWSRIVEVARRNPDKTAVVFGERRQSYDALLTRAAQVAGGLWALGVRPGDRIAYLAQNRPEYLELFFAAARIGAILVPLNTRLGVVDLTAALRRSGARVLFFGSGFRKHDYVALVRDTLGGCEVRPDCPLEAFPELERIICLDDGSGLGLGTYDDVIRGGDGSKAPQPPDDMLQESVGLMLFTSGSSGLPKPVMLGQGQMLRNMMRIGDRQGIRDDDTIMSYLPYFHVYGGLITTLVPLLRGATVVMLEAYDALESLEAAERERCTVIYGVAPCFNGWLDHPNFGKYDLSSIRTGVCSAGLPAMSATAKRVRQAIAPMHSLFGMTETHGVVALTREGDSEQHATGSGGVALPGAEIAIFEPGTKRLIERGAEGEIRIRGDMITRGYFRLPDETERAIDSDGWMHTGDRGYLDDEGYVYIAGRLDERMRCGGENIDPREVERFLTGHASIDQCQVVGIPDKRLGEIPVAFAILRQETEAVTEADIQQFCRGKIADFKIPRRIFLVEEFPGWMHKVQRYRLKEEAIRRMEDTNRGLQA